MNKELRLWLVLASAVLPLAALLMVYITTPPEALFGNPHAFLTFFFTILAIAWYSVVFVALWKKWMGEIRRQNEAETSNRISERLEARQT